MSAGPREPVVLTVDSDTAGRLDRYLATALELSRTAAARLIAERCVFVSGAPARASLVPPRGTKITVVFPELAPRRLIAAADILLSVAHEDDELIVVDKPAGLVVHPAPGHWDDTLVNALAARGLRLGGGAADRPGIVHRLDKDTSGLLVVAKTERAHRALGAALAARHIKRRYAALAWGHIKTEVTGTGKRGGGEGRTVQAAIARHAKDRKRMTIDVQGRHAVTHFTPVVRGRVADLLRCDLETGRTHQIRVHLSSIGHPVVGDTTYGGDRTGRSDATRPEADALLRATPRHALHAAWLELPHPATGKMLNVVSEWPADLRPALALATGDASLLEESKPLRYLGFFDSGPAM